MKNTFLPQKLIFFSALLSSIFICLSSSSFLGIWMSMEINLFSIIPIISTSQMYKSEKSTALYFLIQSISSGMILFSLMILVTLPMMKNMMMMLLLLGLCNKLGLSPFQFWMMSFLENLPWSLCFIMMTLQKIIPIVAILHIFPKPFLIIICLLSAFVASVSGLNMFSMRKVLGYSSLNHLSLMLLAMLLSKKLFKIYFIIYTLMTFSVTKFLKTMNINFIFQTFDMYKYSSINNLALTITVLGMAGLPPFLGFMPKMFTIMMMVEVGMIMASSFILISNALATFFYLRMCLANLLMNMSKEKIKKSAKFTSLPLYILFSPLVLVLM
uniref:NADH dehydrogenase subunit 2 n=1 Tax=Lefroyothrips lefroyi TaxID=1030666 RepID=UPI00292A46C8|nr:NADH dehydrogenase subunit 2 [Lefroyothrips lefroyi]WNL54545.1 NADH dehydrogenase subunit 2 [Lefroyothrips lefroyi]